MTQLTLEYRRAKKGRQYLKKIFLAPKPQWVLFLLLPAYHYRPSFLMISGRGGADDNNNQKRNVEKFRRKYLLFCHLSAKLYAERASIVMSYNLLPASPPRKTVAFWRQSLAERSAELRSKEKKSQGGCVERRWDVNKP